MTFLDLLKQHVLGVVHCRFTDLVELFFEMLRSMDASTQGRAGHAHLLRGGRNDSPVLLQRLDDVSI